MSDAATKEAPPQDNIPPGSVEDQPLEAVRDPVPRSTLGPQSDEPQEEPKPFVDEARNSIFAKFRKDRAKEAPAQTAIKEQEPPFIEEDREQARVAREEEDKPDTTGKKPAQEPAREPKPGAPEKYTLKVDGESYEATRADMVRLLDLDPDDAKDMPLTELKRHAQIIATQRSLLKKTRDLGKAAVSEIPSRQAPEVAKQSTVSPNSGIPPEELEAEIEKLQLGDPKEAAEAFSKLVNRAIQSTSQVRTREEWQDRITRTVHEVGAEAADILDNEDASQFMLAKSTSGLINELKNAGIAPADIATLTGNPALATQAFVNAAVRGIRLKDPKLIMQEAVAATRKVFNMPGEQVTEQVRERQPAPNAQNALRDRQDAKRRLVNTPARGGHEVRDTQEVGLNSRQSAFMKMKAARGQTTG